MRGVVALMLLAGVAVLTAGTAGTAGGSHLPGPARPGSAGVRLVPADSGNEARYRVREQLANHDFPNDAVGTTAAITGALVLDSARRIDTTQSRFVVDLTTLKSDKDRRDGYIQHRTLETEQYPTAVFVPQRFEHYPTRFTAGDSARFELVGSLAIHGVTREQAWEVSAHATAAGYAGTATTTFHFGDFGMEVPHVMVVLSVKDSIALEYDFNLVRR